MNWRGRPLTSHEVVVETIAATTTSGGLTVHAELDPGSYPTGQAVTDAEMATLALTPHHWHEDWNYTLHPRALTPPPRPKARRITESDHAPGWLSHPTLTGMTSREFGQMLTAFSEHLAASPPVSLTPRSYLDPRFGARILSPRDRLLATIISQRWSASRSALASVLGISQSLLARAISETTQDLATMGKTIPPAPIKATTTAALMALIGQEPDPKK